MKNIITKLTIIIGLILIINSCSKEEEPYAEYSASITSAVVGEEIEFTITGDAEYWVFVPGDGNSPTNIEEDVFYYSYMSPGTYTNKLIASNLSGDFTTQRDTAELTITVTDNEEHAFTRFSLFSLELKNTQFAGYEDKMLKIEYTGLIEGTEITMDVPFSAVLDEVKAKFSKNPASVVFIGDVEQVSRKSKNDFNSPLNYRIVASDGSEEITTVTVNRLEKSSNSELLSFGFDALPSGISSSFEKTGNDVLVTLTDSVDRSSLTANFGIQTFARAFISGIEQKSGGTVNDFSSTVVYTVQAEDGSESDFNVNLQTTPVLTRFYFGEGNDFVAEGVFNGAEDTVYVDIPNGSDISSLVASFNTRPYDCDVFVGGTLQVSGSSANDYSAPLIYKLTGDVEREYVVAVSDTFALK